MKSRLHLVWRRRIKPAALFFRPIAVLLLVMAPLRSAVLDWNWVPSGSMKPTIMEGDMVLVNKLAYDLKVPFTTHHLAQWANPKRGDVAVFYSPRDGVRLVKRVVGLPGDTIEMRDDVLCVNGEPLRYTAADTAGFRRDIFESPNPLLATEHLGERDHYVMALPDKPAMRTFGPIAVPPGHYFMMGDSRDNSFDSRYFGAVARDQIIGRAIDVVVSFDPKHYFFPRMGRFTQKL